MIRAVVFDVGGVLTTNPIDEFDRLDAEFGLPRDTVQSFIRGGGEFALVETGRLPVDEFFARCVAEIADRHGVEVPTARLHEMLERCLGTDTRAEMLELGAELKAAGYRIALLTNIPAGRRAWLEGLFAPGVLDVVCDSSEVGLRKPDRAIYEKVVEMLDVSAHEVAFIDDFAENLPPAAQLGMLAICFESPAQTRRALVDAGVRIPVEA